MTFFYNQKNILRILVKKDKGYPYESQNELILTSFHKSLFIKTRKTEKSKEAVLGSRSWTSKSRDL